MIGISARVYDLDGHVVVQELDGSELDTFSRRISVTATLDGGVAVEDRGHAVSDRPFTISARSRSAAERAALKRLIETYAELTLCTADGAFLAAPQSFILGAAELTLAFRIKGVLSG